jgi:transcriptional regulator with XRE-family HTH domain
MIDPIDNPTYPLPSDEQTTHIASVVFITRADLRLTAAECAARAGVAEAKWRDLEKGDSPLLASEMAPKAARVLGIPVEKLVPQEAGHENNAKRRS